MWLKPEEFYNLDIEDYPVIQRANRNKMQTEEGLLRRSAFIVGISSFNGKGNVFSDWFEQVWPYGDSKTREHIEDKVIRLRKQAKEEVEYLNKHAAKIQEVVALKRKAQNAGRGS